MTTPAETQEALARTTLLVRRDIYPRIEESTIAAHLAATRVGLSGGKLSLGTRAGQDAVVTSAILAAQMGVELHLDFPEVALVAPQPPLRGEGLRESLIDLASDLITPAQVGSDFEFEISVGQAPHVRGIGLSGDDLGFKLAPSGTAGGFSGELPIGAGLAAVAAAAEVFRHALVGLGAETGVEPQGEQPLRATLPAAYSLAPFSWRPMDLGRVDSVSAGALATAALYLLLRMPGMAMQLRLMDGDCGGLSNLNRYPLLRRSSLGIPKVDALSAFTTEEMTIVPVGVRLDESSALRLQLLAPRVLVGVDDIPSRWRVQRLSRGWVAVAATSHFEVVVSEHSKEPPVFGLPSRER